MSSPTPRRRPSPAVYRRRRLVALLLALIVVAAIVAGIWAVVAQPWRSNATETPVVSPSPSASASADAAASAPADAETPAAAEESAAPDDAAAADGAPACNAGDVTVEGATSKESYASGENPEFSITLTNTSDADCTINVGTSAQSFTVTSGSDTWWRSTDCQAEPSDMIVTLAAGQTVSSAEALSWDRTRSSVDTCDSADRAQAPGNGASYHLAVEIGGISANGTTQFFLN
ncbi:cytoskeletal protein RodZ [Microbacterium endophyticum]|uniref:Cytoskeletal protein RodZ n=1 Tax=Microbacterium endophyticum TaxID=1526412 RepID=A0A7W4V4Y0_9MICO|nr:hypothetical protein [Microbacterium endophyticum]MBB2976902.1 cytoskeletal protein RodZ [Microbacterium endophyticum]NIK35780.1 cytoskeletal protein RodZ [Microbacterium endophyticum]